jgi:hypothetical protein
LGSLDPLCKDRFDQNLFSGVPKLALRHYGRKDLAMWKPKETYPAEMGYDCLLMVQYASQHVSFILLWIVISYKEDGSMRKGSAQDEAGDVLVMRVEKPVS